MDSLVDEAMPLPELLSPREDSRGGGLPKVASPLTASYGKQIDSSDTPKGPPNIIFTPPLTTNPYGDHESREGLAVAFTQNQVGDVLTGDVCASMGTNQNATGRNTPKVAQSMSVRRLMPVECERLQGFPGDYTLIPYKGKPAADGPRYKALGNSMAVPVVEWILQRIAEVSST